MEKLTQWLKDNRITQRALAAHIGVVESSITDVKKGRQRFTLVVAARIEKATGGKVRAADLADPTEVGQIGRLK
jgi:DNA-binding transcriptional regulator YdaS (Cro superfamily)